MLGSSFQNSFVMNDSDGVMERNRAALQVKAKFVEGTFLDGVKMLSIQ